MIIEISSIIFTIAVTFLLAWPLGKYISNVIGGEKTWLDPVFSPIERGIYRLSGIDPRQSMGWKENLYALLIINFVWFAVTFFVLLNQGWLPLNPDANPSMTTDLALNTTVSFLVNCNLQHYSGETALSYLGQLTLMFLQFVTAGTGFASAALVFKAMKIRLANGREGLNDNGLGNFYDLFFRSTLRVLLPLSALLAIALLFNGTPMTFEGKETIVSLQGDTVQVSRGPAAAMIAIKQIGTNGGGFFGVNSAHPLENPTFFSNFLEVIAILLVPIALVFAFGFYLNRRRLAWVILGVMTFGFALMLIGSVWQEFSGNPMLSNMGIAQPLGNYEGKEIRFGTGASALWGVATTATSNGSVNMMHDSVMPLTGAFFMLDMMMNAFFGGVGVGFLNFYIFIILAVFISGLMVGRTPEFLGKKIEAREMKIAMLVALLHPFLILVGTALSAWAVTKDPTLAWLNNPGFHGFSEMLYEYTSSAANNGSGFEGLGDNNPFWNYTTAVVLLLSRYLPIIGPVAIAGLLATKKNTPETGGTLPTDTTTFGVVILAVIFIIAALSFFPALVLGPIAEHFSL